MFNYSITENIIYGNNNASNVDVKEAADIANALEFIENKEFASAMAINSDADSLTKLLSENKIDLDRLKGYERI